MSHLLPQPPSEGNDISLAAPVPRSLDGAGATEPPDAPTAAAASLDDFLSWVETVGHGVFLLDTDLRFTYVNAVAQAVFSRHRAGDLHGVTLRSLYPSGALETPLYAHVRQALAEDRTIRFEGNSPLFSGWTEFHILPRNGGGAVVFFRDLSERKRMEAVVAESEARLHEAQAVARIGSWQYDRRTGKIEWSLEAFNLFQFSPADGVPDRDRILQRIYPDDVPMVLEYAQRSLDDGTPAHFDTRFVEKRGAIKWMHISIRSEKDSNGEILRLVGTFQDIHERKLLEQAALERADLDPLTNLWNHRAFYVHLHRAERQAAETGAPFAIAAFDLDNFKYFNDTYGHLTGDEVLCQIADAFRSWSREDDIIARTGGDEFAILLPNTDREQAMEWAAELQRNLGTLTFPPGGGAGAIPLRLSLGVAQFPDDGTISSHVLYLADKRAMEDKEGIAHPGGVLERLRRALSGDVEGYSMLDALLSTVDKKDRYTLRHSEQVMEYVRMIAGELHLPDEETLSLQTAALLHDIGKIGVPNHILRQPGRLSAEGYEAIRLHPALGGILVAAVPELAHTLDAVRYHHERWDGGGYPEGLAGDAIPLEARILAVADAYSAMTMDRPYRKGRTEDEARATLRTGAGTQWDAVCVAAFLRALDD